MGFSWKNEWERERIIFFYECISFLMCTYTIKLFVLSVVVKVIKKNVVSNSEGKIKQ